jgi:putative ABC transport system permease protein
MISPRWKKSLSDLTAYKGRSLLVIAAIGLGIWGVGSILASYVILEKDMRTNYLGTRPASATLWTQDNVTPVLVAEVSGRPAIDRAEVRQAMLGRLLVGQDTWLALRLFVVEDFERLRLNTFTLEKGRWPRAGEVVIERDSWRLAGIPEDGDITLRVGDGPRRTLRVTGRAHDPGQPPAHMDHVVYGYISQETYRTLLPDGPLNQLLVSVAERPFDREHIRAVTRDLRTWLDARGVQTTRIDVPVPGRHPHQGQLESLLFLQGSIGLLAFLLCGILIVNIMAFLLARQVRQIGIMKAIGATPTQVVGLYYFSVACLGTLGALLGVPLGVLGGKGYAAFAARELNFTIFTTQLPLWVYLALVAAAIAVPALAATVPILRGTRITVLQALADHGLGAATATEGGPARSSRALLPRPLKLALRAAFRRRGRTLFAIATLALGLTIFAIALNLRATLSSTLSQSALTQGFDLSVFFGRAYSVDRIAPALEGVEGVRETVYWHGGFGSIAHSDATLSNTYPIVAPPVPTRLLDPVMLEGAWFDGDLARAVIVNHQLARAEPSVVVGATLDLRIGTRTERLRVAGIIKEMGALPTLYLPRGTLLQITGEGDATTNLRVVAAQADRAAQLELSRRVEHRLEAAGIDVSTTVRKTEHLKLIEDHLKVITNFLLASSLLALIVAGLGLISTMGINMVERTREIGILRAIGATPRGIGAMIWAEGLLIGVLSWVVGLALAVPLSDVVSQFFGSLIFDTPLDLTVSSAGAPLAFVVMAVFVAVATLSAAVGITKTSLRDALAYE